MNCPHADVIFCPLYVAAHLARGLGCDDGQLGDGGCAVDRRLNYRAAIERLRAREPRLVAELAFLESSASARAQRIARNRRLL